MNRERLGVRTGNEDAGEQSKPRGSGQRKNFRNLPRQSYGRSSIGTTFLPTGSPTYSLNGR